MNRGFYTKLAFTNIKKNSKTYIPYILTCICTIMMFYMVRTLAMNEGLMNMTGGQQLSIILELGSFVVGIFSLIFLFYTNSFLIKRRKKEFGLFNILGMEKKHISKIMTLESVFVGIFSFIVGILGGIVLTKLMYMLLCKLLQFEIPLKFDINLSAIIMTAILFLVIFLINLLNALRQVQLAKPIELLAGGNVGEKEPKTKWIMAILGFLTLGAGYYIAVSAKNPVEAMGLFFVAVILVIIGTELLFIAGSIAILKILRKNKRFYYQTKHFTTVSGMMYRMKQNAAGLSNICILSTMVIIMIAGTVSLYVGMNDVMGTQFPRNIVLSSYDISNEQNVKINEIIKDNADKFNVNLENQLEYHSFGVYANQKENAFYKFKSDES
ncbi:MAG: ABC transporter permease, partial [Oscillospiraceae bacterium]